MQTCRSPILVASCVLLLGLVVHAAETHEGSVVSVQEGAGNSDGTLVMTDKDGKGEHSHMISQNVSITRDRKPVKLRDLKKGDSIKVTIGNDGKVTELVSMPKNSDRSSNSTEHAFPESLSNINLTTEQKDKIKNICQECQADRESAWNQFGDRYRELIGIEASMLAAIEDNLTEEQRRHISTQRHRMARKDSDSSKDSAKNTNDETSKQNARSKDNSANRNDRSKNEATNEASNNAIVEEITVIGVTLSADQQMAVEGVRGNYFERLRKLNSEMEQLHGRLVAMETERLLKIEEVLTKDQRHQLREEHRKLDRSARHSASVDRNSK